MRESGRTSEAAVAEAVVAAEKPTPCKMRATKKTGVPVARTGRMVPMNSKTVLTSMTITRPMLSMIGPHAKRVTPAEAENTAANTPASVAPSPRWFKYTDVPEFKPWPTTKLHKAMAMMKMNSGVHSLSFPIHPSFALPRLFTPRKDDIPMIGQCRARGSD